VLDELCTWHFGRAQRGQVGGVLLAVDAADAVDPAKRHQRRQGDLGRIPRQRKHRLAIDGLSYRHAVKPSGQFAIDPGFDAVRVTRFVQGTVGLLHLRQYPRATLGRALARAAGAVPDDACERRIDADLAFGRPHKAAQCLAQRGVQAKVIDLQHHTRIRAPPQNWLALAEPRKDASGIGRQQTLYIQSPTRGE
jgi:hypothetical protein